MHISALGLEFRRDHFKLGPLQFEWKGPGWVRVVGANGSGKTTLLKIISERLKPFAGKIEKSHKTLGWVGVEPTLIQSWCVSDYMHWVFGLCDRKVPSSLIDEFKSWLWVPIEQLSTGWRRSLEIQIQLELAEEILLLDEAFNGLDQDRKRHVIEKINYRAEKNLLVVYTSHETEPYIQPRHEIRL